MREPYHPFYRGDIYLLETILWGFHPYQETVERDGQKLEPIQLQAPLGRLGWNSTGPKAFEWLKVKKISKPFRSLVTPSFETAMSSMKGADLLRNGHYDQFSVFESTTYLKFAHFQYVSSGFCCRVIAGSLLRLY